MIEIILSKLSLFIISLILITGYWGIFILMMVESMGIPFPSEIIMPFSGFLVAQNKFNFWFVVLAGVLGNWVGSVIFYFIGIKLRLASNKWQKFQQFFEEEIKKGDKWFSKYGNWAVFINRILPAVRTFISLPAGFFKLNFFIFNIFTIAGSFIWSVFLTYVGFYFGENWQSLHIYFKKFNFVILGILVIGLVYVGLKFYKKIKHYKEKN